MKYTRKVKSLMNSKFSKIEDIDKVAKKIILATFIGLFILSLFRFVLYDERYYLRETALMSFLLKEGIWFGNYGVGVHGFLFKLPVALVYIFTGPSVFIATFFHIILAIASLYIFYRILVDNLKLGEWSLLSLLLFVTNYRFISYSITYHRETPILFSVLLFLKYFLDKKRPLIIGVLLLLILDAKEYIMILVVFSLIIFYLIKVLRDKKVGINKIPEYFKNIALILAPSVIYIFLMFFTSVIPLNMTLANLMGLGRGSIAYQIRHLAPSQNYWQLGNGIVTKKIVEINADDEILRAGVKKFVYIPFAYLEKFFYITRFSFQSLPLILLLPSLISAALLLKNGKNNTIFIPILLFSYTFIHIFKVSHQRYLYPLLPLYLGVFVVFLKDYHRRKIKENIINNLFIFSTLIFIIMLFFPQYNQDKKIFEIIATGAIILVAFLFQKYNKKLLIPVVISFVLVSNIFINVYANISKSQLTRSLKWGVNGETRIIAGLVDSEDKIYINHTNIKNEGWISNIQFYRVDPILYPQYKRELYDWVPKKKLLKMYDVPNTYHKINWKDVNELNDIVTGNNINKVVMIESLLEGVSFYRQDEIDLLKDADFLSLELVKELKNKKVYIFEVEEEQKR
ncbi:hypothetical protein ACFLZK_00590 [Patescibacteria group bacterium]